MVGQRLKLISDLKRGSCSISQDLGPPPCSNPIPSHCSHGPLSFLDKHQDSFSFKPFCLGHSIVVMNGYLYLLCGSPLSRYISLSFTLPQYLCLSCSSPPAALRPCLSRVPLSPSGLLPRAWLAVRTEGSRGDGGGVRG